MPRAKSKKTGEDSGQKKLNEKDRRKMAKSHKIITEQVSVVQATEMRANFQEAIDRVHYTKEAILISKHKKPWVIIAPLSENK